MKKRGLLIAALTILILMCSCAAEGGGHSATGEVITTLAALPNRVPGSENNEKAAEWLAKQYERLGLKALEKEDYFWPYKQSMSGAETEPNNVVGYIAGRDNARATIISCHFDAVVGSAGAVDNASGVAAMLRVASKLSAAADELKEDYIFCAFNGEEQFYIGSKAFVKEFDGLYETVRNINFDCVGMIDGGAYMFGAEEGDVGYDLNAAIRPFLEKHKIKLGAYQISGVRSDHISFENAGIPNINFTQGGILGVTHSVRDTVELLDTEQIDLVADCVTEYLLS